MTGNEPLSTCQKQHKEALQLPATPFNFIPTCKRDGRFEEVQCLRATKECWCVDESGKETNGTRTTGYLKCPSEGIAFWHVLLDIFRAKRRPNSATRFHLIIINSNNFLRFEDSLKFCHSVELIICKNPTFFNLSILARK